MRAIIINSSHISDSTNNNKFEYRPAQPIRFEEGDSIALAGLQMYYSTFNITSTYGNNTIGYTWVDGTSVSITITDGFYSIDTLNSYLQREMITRGHYLVSISGSYLYYLTLELNVTYYGCQLNAYALPTSAQASSLGYSRPAGATWSFPVSAVTPQWVVSSGIQDILGITAGTYPSSTQSTDYYTLSTTAPQVHPVQSYILHCNVLANDIAVPPTILYSFAPDTTFGSLISVRPSEYAFVDLRQGNYSSLEFRITAQDFSNVTIKDPSIVLFLLIRGRDER